MALGLIADEFQIARVEHFVRAAVQFTHAQRCHAVDVAAAKAAQIPAAQPAPGKLDRIAQSAAGLGAADVLRQRFGLQTTGGSRRHKCCQRCRLSMHVSQKHQRPSYRLADVLGNCIDPWSEARKNKGAMPQRKPKIVGQFLPLAMAFAMALPGGGWNCCGSCGTCPGCASAREATGSAAVCHQPAIAAAVANVQRRPPNRAAKSPPRRSARNAARRLACAPARQSNRPIGR